MTPEETARWVLREWPENGVAEPHVAEITGARLGELIEMARAVLAIEYDVCTVWDARAVHAATLLLDDYISTYRVILSRQPEDLHRPVVRVGGRYAWERVALRLLELERSSDAAHLKRSHARRTAP
jgi:hypothetical protein